MVVLYELAATRKGGAGGTVNIRTRNPLDPPSTFFSGSLQGAYADEYAAVMLNAVKAGKGAYRYNAGASTATVDW